MNREIIMIEDEENRSQHTNHQTDKETLEKALLTQESSSFNTELGKFQRSLNIKRLREGKEKNGNGSKKKKLRLSIKKRSKASENKRKTEVKENAEIKSKQKRVNRLTT